MSSYIKEYPTQWGVFVLAVIVLFHKSLLRRCIFHTSIFYPWYRGSAVLGVAHIAHLRGLGILECARESKILVTMN